MMFEYRRGGNGSLRVLTTLIMSVHNRLDVDLLEVSYLKIATNYTSYRFEVKNYPNPS